MLSRFTLVVNLVPYIAPFLVLLSMTMILLQTELFVKQQFSPLHLID